ncbi:hypothetical protein L873DRAFT_1797175 [Choiromyces venosus 120613-1]|uniref:Uncharacterized protein n=1 Tax=Choiromyces venosus 120613-1 TaxID=1336337 RepID=A0A3N4K6M3_9PEZI|nr:hypothetical protein L873DRAFT_1797175 [Choiromyces venosus 120613-1]
MPTLVQPGSGWFVPTYAPHYRASGGGSGETELRQAVPPPCGVSGCDNLPRTVG